MADAVMLRILLLSVVYQTYKPGVGLWILNIAVLLHHLRLNKDPLLPCLNDLLLRIAKYLMP